jgi:hypothetical protein
VCVRACVCVWVSAHGAMVNGVAAVAAAPSGGWFVACMGTAAELTKVDGAAAAALTWLDGACAAAGLAGA